MNLSPLNFSGLIALAATPLGDLPEDHPARNALDERRQKRGAIECWKCPDCDEVYDDEDDAVECRQDDDHLHTPHDQDGVSLCPICASAKRPWTSTGPSPWPRWRA